MFKKCLWAGICILALGIGSVVNAADMEAILDDNTSSTGFSIKDNNENTLMRIQGDGNVGIGTAGPTQKLEVSGNSVISGNVLTGATFFNPSHVSHAVLQIGPVAIIRSNKINSLDLVSNNYSTDVNRAVRAGIKASWLEIESGGIHFHTAPAASNDGDPITFTERMVINNNGNVSIGGKLTVTGGVDPPYVSFSDESHGSIRELAKEVEEHEKVMQFWNGKAHRMEVYVIEEDKFYTIAGELIE